MIYHNAKGISIGELIAGKYFLSVRNSKEHLFRNGRRTNEQAIKEKVAAWGLDVDVLKDLEEKGAERIIIMDTDTMTYYSTDIGAFDVYGDVKSFGHGKQCFLKLHMFKESDNFDDATGRTK